MSGESIPDQIAQFIVEKIDSVAQLEALLLLCGKPEDRWSLQALARLLYIDEKQTAELLSRLAVQRLVSADGEPPLYCYDPSSTDVRNLVDRLAEIYAKQLVRATQLISLLRPHCDRHRG
jgi:hypothetical protein